MSNSSVKNLEKILISSYFFEKKSIDIIKSITFLSISFLLYLFNKYLLTNSGKFSLFSSSFCNACVSFKNLKE